MTILSGIVKNGKLVDEFEWKKNIESLKTKTFLEKEDGKKLLKEKLVAAVEKRATDNFGVLFSGGLDSTTIALICKQLGKKFTCYSVGFKGSQDLEWAAEIAYKFDFHLKTRLVNLEQVEEILKQTIKLLGKRDIVSAAVGAVVFSGLGLAKEDKTKILFSGLGSEEIFAGYQRHELAKDVHEECWRGLKNMWQRDFVRDYTIAKHFGVDIMTPFLDEDVIKTAMQIKPEHKLDSDYKKIILREIAEEIGLPKKFAWRKKKAAQYGSNFDKAILKLAKRNGFKYKKEYLENL